jgi:hypothetical protein
LRTFLFAVLITAPIALLAWIAFRGFVATPRDPDQALLALFSGLPQQLSLTTPPKLYDQKGLFEYVDGAAPIFIERHFRKLAAAEMKSSDGGELTCDVYDMQSGENASAIFTKETTPSAQPLGVGDDGRRGRMFAVFRRGRYYVKLTAFNPAGDSTLAELARALAAKMP